MNIRMPGEVGQNVSEAMLETEKQPVLLPPAVRVARSHQRFANNKIICFVLSLFKKHVPVKIDPVGLPV